MQPVDDPDRGEYSVDASGSYQHWSRAWPPAPGALQPPRGKKHSAEHGYGAKYGYGELGCARRQEQLKERRLVTEATQHRRKWTVTAAQKDQDPLDAECSERSERHRVDLVTPCRQVDGCDEDRNRSEMRP